MAETRAPRTEDLVSLGSRISWGTIIAGSVIALATFLVLTLLGGSIGLSIRDEVTSETFGTTASIWAIASSIIALFVGGIVTSQCTVGENPGESVIHGIIMWGVVFAFIVWLTATGVRAGFNAMIGVASVGTNAMQGVNESWESLAPGRRATGTDRRMATTGLRKRSERTEPGASRRRRDEGQLVDIVWRNALDGGRSDRRLSGFGADVRIIGVASTSATTFRSPLSAASEPTLRATQR